MQYLETVMYYPVITEFVILTPALTNLSYKTNSNAAILRWNGSVTH